MPYPHKFIKLTFAERVRIRLAIEEFYKKGQYYRCKPLEAFQLSDRGFTFDRIGFSLKVTYRTIQTWFSRYWEYGLEWFLQAEKPRKQARKIRRHKKRRMKK
ncbi:MAG: helix-turn-helix domain-containing protein [Planctomycetota bacterium]